MASVVGGKLTEAPGFLLTADYDDVTGVITQFTCINNSGRAWSFNFVWKGADHIVSLPVGTRSWSPPPGNIKWLTDQMTIQVF